MAKQKKQFFSKHAKSSAALVSLGIHAVLVVIALSFVAVTVIKKEESSFEAKPVNRPKMQLKKLQVPVNIKKKQVQKPKLRKRIVVQPKVNQSVPDIKMPEITGVKGGIGNAGGDGLGGAGGLGFSMPEISVFGVKSRGEKIFIILDSSPWIMYDEIGGIPAYNVIKEELVNILDGLNPTVLFNISVFNMRSSVTRFPTMVSASSSNVSKVRDWLENLNAVKKGMGDKDYGLHTLGEGSIRLPKSLPMDPVQETSDWSTPLMMAMQQQADTVYILTERWGWQHHEKKAAQAWPESKRAKYEQIKKEAKRKLEQENAERKKSGMPPRVLIGFSLINEYFPGTEHPPRPEYYHYSSKELYAAFSAMRKKYKPKTSVTSGLGMRSKKREQFSINVIHFVPKDNVDEKTQAKFQQLVRVADGEYKTLSGLDAIKSSASSANSK